MIVKIKLDEGAKMPEYQTRQAAGADLFARLTEKVTINPMERVLIPTGVHIQMPEGYEAQVRPRSGLAIHYGVTVLNSPGTVDADYCGEIGVILINLGTEPFVVSNGDRIAQLVIAKHENFEWGNVLFLEESERGEGGYGSTGR